MIYAFLQITIPFLMRVFFRKMYFVNEHLVPRDKPVILACNHPNSFMDALVIGSLLKQSVYYLARSDVFNTPLKRWILRCMHMIPIYRLLEGTGNLHKNEKIFNYSHRLLKKNKNILIFSEGICIHEKRLRKLKKGTARMAFIAETNYDFKLDVHIVPVAINYTYPSSFRGDAMIEFLPPIRIKEYETLYKENEAKAINSFNETLTEILKKNVIIINRPEDEDLAEHLLIMTRNNKPFVFFPWKVTKSHRQKMEKEVCDKINYLSSHDQDILEWLKKNVRLYFYNLSENKINDRITAGIEKFEFLKILSFIFIFPVFVAGFFGNILPLKIAKRIALKKVKQIEFYLSIYAGAFMLLYIIYFCLMLFVSYRFWNLYGLLPVLLLPLFGFLALYYLELFTLMRHVSHKRSIEKNDLSFLAELRKMRSSILQCFDKVCVLPADQLSTVQNQTKEK